MAESNGKPTRRREWIAVGAITAAALALRLAGIWWGLPNSQHYFSYHPDEIFVLLPSFGFAQGDWNPHFFNYGTLYLYLVGIPAVIFGIVPDPLRFPQGLAPLYLTGRIVTALLGTASVPLLYLALRRENRSLAWGSALLLTICPLHVINSHYATVDVPATFFLVVAFLFALRGAERATLKNAILTGLFFGLAAAAKYNAGIFLLPALLAPALNSVGQELACPERSRRTSCPHRNGRKASISWWLGLPAGALVAFLVCNPWIGTPEFRQGFLFEWRHAQAGGTFAFVGTGSGWSYHLVHGLPVALGYPLLAAVILGVILAFRSKSPAVRLSLLWVILYFFVIGFGKERFIRYLVPMTPFLCVLAVWGICSLLRLAKRPATENSAVLLGIAVLLLTGLYSLGQSAALLGIDGRDLAWLQTDSDIIEKYHVKNIGLATTPWFHDPPVSPYNAGAFSRPMFDEWNRSARRPVVVADWDARKLRSARPDVFFLSDLESQDLLRLHDPKATEFVEALSHLYAESWSFHGAPAAASWALGPPRSWAPPDWLYPQPIITVYYSPRP
jgi:4-amino-4-deoxy-L-arabinose transferase-like glycosyltransferase